MKRFMRPPEKQASVALTLVFILSWGLVTHAQAALPTMALQESATETATTAAPRQLSQLDEARAQLKQALELRNQQTIPKQGQARQDLALDKQRLLDWLIDLQQEKTSRIEELATLRNMVPPPVDEDPMVKALQGKPPYAANQVDALRDDIDGMKEKLAAAQASFNANQIELQNLQDQLKVRAAATRQASERTMGTHSDADMAKIREELDVQTLLQHIAEVEIAITALDQDRLKLQIAAWRGRIDGMQAVVTKVLPDQKLSLDDLAIQRQRVRTEDATLASEIERVSRQNALHRAERDRSLAAGRGVNGQTAKPSFTLELTLKTDNGILKGLEHLQMLNRISGDAWEKRYAVLSSTDPEQRRVSLTALNELAKKLVEQRSQTSTRQEALQTEIRAQRIRLDNLTKDREEQGREKDILNLLLRQAAMGERLERAATRLEKQVSRWLADFAEPSDQGLHGHLIWVRDGAMAILQKIWMQELFVVEDVSEVDGRKVSVKYGITVGKSIGIVVVFIVGYWLLAKLSRLIQHQMVRRLRVSHQFASVIRRWSMIGLSLALIVLLLNLARIPLSVFTFLGGTLAIGVGFGAQTIIKNFISGLIVLFERKIRVGDVVELGGVQGYVTAVDLRATTVRAFNGVEALIPNANFIENQVINWTYSSRQIRRELPVDIAYGTDIHLVESLFLAAAAEHASVLKDPVPEVFFDGFGDHALKVVLVYWVEFDGAKGPRRVDSDLRHDIYARLATAGIAIPFPQRDIHVNFAPSDIATATNLEPFRAK